MSISLHKNVRPLAFAGAARVKLTAAARAEAAARNATPESTTGEGVERSGARPDTGGETPAPPRPWLAPTGSDSRPQNADARPPTGSDATAAPTSTTGNRDDQALEAVVAKVQDKLGALANDPEAFHEALTKSFGDRYDKAAAETIRQQVIAGDFSWLPKIEVVDGATLGDTSGTQGEGQALGAYSAETDTVYISRELLASDPDKAASVLTEEIGHGLDTRLNVADSAGDEGAIFSALVDGKDLSDADLATLQTENDSGTIVVDGKEVEVEYNFLKKGLKKLKKGVKKIANKVGDVVTAPIKKVYEVAKKVHEFHKEAFKKIMQSELLGTIMAVAQYIPIPIVAAVATVYNTVKAGYMVYRGIKEKSFSTVLSGVAGLAGGAAKLGTAFGASAKFVKGAATISQRANQASRLYSLRGDVSFRNAAAVGADLFGGTRAGTYFKAADRGIAAYDAAQNGDALGALAIGADAFRELPGTRHDATLENISDHALNGRAIVAAAESKDYASVIGVVNREYGTALGLDESTRGRIDDLVDVARTADRAVGLANGEKDYAGAAELLFTEAADKFSSPVVSGRFRESAEFFATLGDIKAASDEGRLGDVGAGTLELLGQPLDARSSSALLDVLDSVDVLRGTATGTTDAQATPLLRAATFGRGAYDASQRGDDLGALALGADAFRALPGTRFDAALGTVSDTAVDGRAVVALANRGDTAGAISLANERFGTRLNLDASGKARLDDLVRVIGTAQTAVALAENDQNYAGAAEALFGGLAGLETVSPTVRARFERGAELFDRLGNIKENIDEKRLEIATVDTLALLGEPLDEKTRDQALAFLGFIDTLRGTSTAASPSARADVEASATAA